MLELVDFSRRYNFLFLRFKCKNSRNKTVSLLLTNSYFFFRRRRKVQKDENEVT